MHNFQYSYSPHQEVKHIVLVLAIMIIFGFATTLFLAASFLSSPSQKTDPGKSQAADSTLVKNGFFGDGVKYWNISSTTEAGLTLSMMNQSPAALMTINSQGSAAILYQGSVVLQKNIQYLLTFKSTASVPASLIASITSGSSIVSRKDFSLSTSAAAYQYSFISSVNTTTGRLNFTVTAPQNHTMIWLDEIRLIPQISNKY